MSKTQSKRYKKIIPGNKKPLKGGKNIKILEIKNIIKKYAFTIEYFLEMLNKVKLYHWKTIHTLNIKLPIICMLN